MRRYYEAVRREGDNCGFEPRFGPYVREPTRLCRASSGVSSVPTLAELKRYSSENQRAARRGDAMTVYLRYQADIWVEIDTEAEDVVNVVVDDSTMVGPVDVVDDGGVSAGAENRTRAQRIADSSCWPSWDYGPPPVQIRRRVRTR
jgi:hypothetical protein